MATVGVKGLSIARVVTDSCQFRIF